MGKRAVSLAQKQEAIALAAVIGAKAAAKQLGWYPQTVRDWCAKAGKAPADAISSLDWRPHAELLMAQVAARAASGKMRDRDLLVAAGIATDKVRRAEREATSRGEQSAVEAREQFAEWLVNAEGVIDEAADAEEQWFEAARFLLGPGLLGLANEEARPESRAADNEPPGHRQAMLAWFSGRTEVPAGDVFEWAQAQTLALVEEHGGLIAWHRWRLEQDEAERAAREAEVESIKQARLDAEAARIAAEVAELIAEAEAFLRDTAA